jgi:predicted phosphate transport protein (TIGR00153 family)
VSILLKKTKKLEIQIDEFLDKILTGALVLRQGVKYYLNNQIELFHERLVEINALENEADSLRRTIETKLYMHTLIPEYRGDVLGLLESSDKVMNTMKETLFQFDVENPIILPEFLPLFLELIEATISAVESMVSAVRSYFMNMQLVRDHINKTIFFEKESDKIADKVKRMIFADPDLDLSQKVHIRYFAHHIETIADAAEDVTDRLAIAVIKRYA